MNCSHRKVHITSHMLFLCLLILVGGTTDSNATRRSRIDLSASVAASPSATAQPLNDNLVKTPAEFVQQQQQNNDNSNNADNAKTQTQQQAISSNSKTGITAAESKTNASPNKSNEGNDSITKEQNVAANAASSSSSSGTLEKAAAATVAASSLNAATANVAAAAGGSDQLPQEQKQTPELDSEDFELDDTTSILNNNNHASADSEECDTDMMGFEIVTG